MYLAHYQAWLLLPSFMGIILWFYQILTDLDNKYNSYFGIFLSIWSALFVDSWKNKQKILSKIWDMEKSKDVLLENERHG